MKFPSGLINESYAQELSAIRTRFQWAALIVALVIACALPLLLSENWVDFCVRTIITLIIVLGLEIITGYAGQFSLGHAAFAAVGAFAGAIMMKYGVPYIIALLGAGFAAGLAGVIFALPSGRVKELYLAFATLAAQFIITFVIIHYAGGGTGYPVTPPQIGDIVFNTGTNFYYFVLVVLVILTIFAKNILRSKTGRAFIAIRDHDLAAKTLGINIFYYKLLAFFIGCFFAGVGGLLYVTYLQWATISNFTLWQSFWYLGTVIIGGMGSVAGAFLGTIFVQLMIELSNILAPSIGVMIPMFAGTVISALPDIVFSTILLLFLIFEPRGLEHRWNIIRRTVQIFPYNY